METAAEMLAPPGGGPARRRTARPPVRHGTSSSRPGGLAAAPLPGWELVFSLRKWLSGMDSNHDKELQRLLCYHYTTGQGGHNVASRHPPCKGKNTAFPGPALFLTRQPAAGVAVCVQRHLNRQTTGGSRPWAPNARGAAGTETNRVLEYSLWLRNDWLKKIPSSRRMI